MIIPDILETTKDAVVEKIKLIENVTPLIHIDVMDRVLFNGQAIKDVEFLSSVISEADFELHLMVKNPLEYVKKAIPTVRRIVSQVESDHVKEFVIEGKRLGYEIGLSIDIETPTSAVEPYLERIDYVQFMSINTGKSGQKLKPEVYGKIEQFNTELPIQIDGNCNATTIPQLLKVGASRFAVNSAIFKSTDPVQKKLELDKLLN